MSNIIELHAENFKRLKAITIRPEGNTVVVGGRNAQGKSSTLDAIMAALGGGRTLPDDPIRHGEKRASIRVELDDLVITRKFTKTGSKLEVVAKDGSVIKKPQQVLDALTGSLSFDPLAFTRESAKDQAETLRQLAGLDLSEIDAEIEKLFEARKDQNRDAKRLKGAAESAVHNKGLPVDPLVMGDLIAELTKRRAHNENRNRLKGQRTHAMSKAGDVSSQIEIMKANLAELEANAADLYARLEAGADEDCDEAQAAIESAEETNALIRENEKGYEAREAYKEAQEAADTTADQLEQARAKRTASIEAASFPIDGLSIDDDGVSYQGVPFSQASGAEKIRVSTAIGLAMNPELKVLLIRDGSLLDGDAMASLQELASEAGAQLWIERVGDGDVCGIIIEDGEVV